MRSYGLPYMGSKSRIAKKIIDFLPSAANFYDLFMGGGAMAHCAALSSKYRKVDGNMTYKDWRESLSPEQEAALKLAQKKDARRTADKVQYGKYKHVLGTKNVPKSLDAFQNLKYTGGEEWEMLKGFYRYKLNNPQADRNAYNCVKELRSVGIKGNIHIPKRDDIDITKLAFDDAHINGQRKHGVTEKEAKEYINTALVSITKRKGITENYFSKTGAAYVNPTENVIKTAYSKDEFKGETLIIMEVLRKYGY